MEVRPYAQHRYRLSDGEFQTTSETRYWFGDTDGWIAVAKERIGDKNVSVVSAMFSVPREPVRKYEAKPVRELEAA